MNKTIRIVALAAIATGIARAEFPDITNPSVTLKEIPLGQQLDVGGVSFFPDGRMLLTTTESEGGGEAPDPNSGSNVWVVSGVQGDLSGVSMQKIATNWRQPVGAVVTPAGKAYISDRDGFYEIL